MLGIASSTTRSMSSSGKIFVGFTIVVLVFTIAFFSDRYGTLRSPAVSTSIPLESIIKICQLLHYQKRSGHRSKQVNEDWKNFACKKHSAWMNETTLGLKTTPSEERIDVEDPWQGEEEVLDTPRRAKEARGGGSVSQTGATGPNLNGSVEKSRPENIPYTSLFPPEVERRRREELYAALTMEMRRYKAEADGKTFRKTKPKAMFPRKSKPNSQIKLPSKSSLENNLKNG